ncbi:MAG: APC family permease [Gemmatimonadaceae bacterium]
MRLARVLGTRELLTIVVGSVIGSGIFLVPGTVLRQTGSVTAALVVWLAGGVLSLLGALTYAELGAMRPESGGLYVYIRDCFGRFTAFLFGWTIFFVVASGAVAALAVAFAAYLGQLVPLGPVGAKVAAIAMIAALAALNVRGTRESAHVQNGMTVLKVLLVIVMSAVLLALGTGGARPDDGTWAARPGGSVLAGAGLAMIGTLWAYEGWQYVTYSAGEARDPQRTLPRALAIGTAGLIALYLAANLAYLAALGPAGVAGSERVAADAVTTVIGPAAGSFVAAIILVSVFSAANGVTLTGSRVFYAMARDRLFFQRMATVHPRFGTPAFAVVACSAWAMLLAASGTFDQLLTYVVFTSWIFYGLGALAVVVYRIRLPDAPRPFRVPAYPLPPLLFVGAALALVLNTMVTQPLRAALGLGVVLLGTPAYLVWRGRMSGVGTRESGLGEEAGGSGAE